MQLKHVALIALEFVVLASLLVVFITFWSGTTRMSSATPNVGTIGVAEGEQILKAKLDDYSKRADDLQKLISLLLGLTTIYAIVLGVSAYATLQNNLQQADKAIKTLDSDIKNNLQQADKTIVRLDSEVKSNLQRAEGAIRRLDDEVKSSLQRAERAITRLDGLRKEHEELMDKTRVEFPQELEKVRQTTTYFGRIALATAASAFPLDSDDYKDVQENVISGLLELRSGQYPIDPVVNQRLARLYKALGRYRNAEEVMTGFIERKESLGQKDDPTIVDAYYDRACYQALRLAQVNSEEKSLLLKAVERDLSRVFDLNDTLKGEAQKDPWLKSVWSEDWFKNLTGS